MKKANMLRNKSKSRIMLLIPLFFFLSLTFFYPIFYQIYLSFHEYTLYTTIPKFVGFANYITVIHNPIFLLALKNALIWTFLSVIFQVSIGLGVALLLYKPSIIGYRIFRSISLLPFVLPPVVLAVTWKWMYNPLFGLLNYLIVSVGGQPVDFLSRKLALYSVTWVNIWKAFPFFTLFMLAGLQSIPKELYEAAKIDGAGSINMFRYITFPLIKSLIIIMSLFATVWTFNYFDLLYAMTQGGPGHATEILATLAYKNVFINLRFDYAATMGVYMFFINAIPVIGILILLRRKKT